MDLDSFFTSPRWKILEILAKKPSSPLEISSQLNTSIAYISQQLKLLEAAGLITKEKTGIAEKGKPRTLFSLSNELLYMMLLTKNLTVKKLIHLTDYHKVILRIWLLEDLSLHYYIEKLYWKIEEELSEVKAIFFDNSSGKPKIIIFSNSKQLKQKIDSFFKEVKGRLEYSFFSENEIKKFSIDKLVPIYDSNLFNKSELKGGENGQKKD